MDKQERDRLRALATEATPGPWRCAGSPDSPCPVVSSHHRSLGYQLHTMLDVKRQDPDVWRHMKGTYQRDAQYIAAASPDVLLRLLDALDAAEWRAEAAERDAARYRWAREGRDVYRGKLPCAPWVVRVENDRGMPTMVRCSGAALDAAIDAALGEQTGEGGGNADPT